MAARPGDRVKTSSLPNANWPDAAARDLELRLVADAKRENREAFGGLYQIHQRLILRVARRITGHLKEVQNAVQDSLHPLRLAHLHPVAVLCSE